MRKLFIFLAVIVVVTLATSCSLPSGASSAQKDTVLSGNDVTLADVTVNVDSRDFSTTEVRSCYSAVQVGNNSCGITIEVAP